ncbi:MAG: hypothetical protein ACFFBD_23615 [Candidatus Hodarchaeota archaeon]
MELKATELSAEPEDGEYLAYFYLRDDKKDYCFSLSRYTHEDFDDGFIEVMVSDQIHTKTPDLSLILNRESVIVRLPSQVASELDCDAEFLIDIGNFVDKIELIHKTLNTIFRGKTGFSNTILK